MTTSGPVFETLIAARGPLVLRDNAGNLPTGYAGFGPVWALNVLSLSLPLEVTLQDGRFVIAAGTSLAENRRVLHALWQKHRAILRPDPWFHVAHSMSGLPDAGILAQMKPDETTRADQIKRYLDAQTTRLPPPGMPVYVDAVLRQLAVMWLPSQAQSSLSRQGTDGWHLRFDEQGKLEHLWDWLENGPVQKSQKGETLIPATEEKGASRDTKAMLVALARALQLTRILLAAGPDQSAQLDIEVAHAGLQKRVLCLSVRPQDRGLGLMRLSQAVAAAFDSGSEPPGLEALSQYGPLVRYSVAATRAPSPDIKQHTAPPPVSWQPDTATALPRWTYAGTGGMARALPFAIAPHTHDLGPQTGTALVFSRLSGADRLAYLDWLAGPRRSVGFRPMFADLYLQGIEYRLLTATGPAAEQADLLQEIVAVAALVPPDDRLRPRLAQLIDWIAATRMRDTANPGQYGLLSSLLDLGSAVAAGRSVSGPAVLTLVRHLHPDLSPLRDAAFLAAFYDAHPARLTLRAPKLALVASYRSLCGLCNVPYFRFGTEAAAVPDLRGSVVFTRLLAQLMDASGGAAE